MRHVCVALLLSGCAAIGGREDACGEVPAGGGPARIVTRDQELCEVVRLRVERALATTEFVTLDDIDRLLERTLAWERRTRLAEFLDLVRRDAGDRFADEVRRAIEAVAARSQRSMRAECGAPETCLVRGAAKGARLALLAAGPTPAARPRGVPPTGP